MSSKLHRFVIHMAKEDRPYGETENPKSKKTGRPPKPMPEPIPDTPENIMKALVNTPPKKASDWTYPKRWRA